MSEPLGSARRKLNRAKSHWEDLGFSMAEFFSAEPPQVSPRLDAAGKSYELALRTELPDEWPVMIGDFLQDARSALEHLAWAAAKRNTAKPAREVTFPVLRDGRQWEQRFGTGAKEEILAIGSDALAIMKSAQPFASEIPAHQNPFLVLHDLARLDRHREIHLLPHEIPIQGTAQMFGAYPQVGNLVKAGPLLKMREHSLPLATKPLKNDDVTGRWTFGNKDTGPYPESKQPDTYSYIVFDVVFGDTLPDAAGQSALQTLTVIGASCEHLFEEFQALNWS